MGYKYTFKFDRFQDETGGYKGRSFGRGTVDMERFKTGELPVQQFKIYDADGEHYASGVLYDENDSASGFEPLNRLMYDYGATEIRYKNPSSGKFETL